MNKIYEKPAFVIDTELAEGVYAASGAGSVDVADNGVWDAWDGGGKRDFRVNWSGMDGTVILTLNFNDSIDQINVEDAAVQTAVSGSTATITIGSGAVNPMLVSLHLNHGTSIYDLALTGYTHSVQ